MPLTDYLRIILRRGWIMVLLAVVAAVAAFLFSQQMTPVYRSSQTVLMVPSRADFGLQQASTQLLAPRVAFLQSSLVAAQIIDELQLDMEPNQLLAQTDITPRRENLTIQIDVDMTAPDAETAAALLNPIASAWGQKLIQEQEELNQTGRVEDRIRARPQDVPQLSLLRPNTRINVLIGAIGGLLLGAIIVFLLELSENNIVRRREDLERQLDLDVLAAVPSA